MNSISKEKLKSWLNEELKYGYVPMINLENLNEILDYIILWYSPKNLISENDYNGDLFQLLSCSLTDEQLAFLKCENLDIETKNTGNKEFDLKQNLTVKNNLFNVLLRNEIIKISIDEIIENKTIFPELGIKSANKLIDSFKENICHYSPEYINYEKCRKRVK